MKRVFKTTGVVLLTFFVGCAALFAAWLGGLHVPVASGATYVRIEKLPPSSRADRLASGPGSPFFVLLVGNDSRPGVGGARGDALHLLGVNPSLHQATMLDIPRDTCWHGDKINAGNTRNPRAQADDVSGLVGVPVSYVVDVDFDQFTHLVDGVGGVDVTVPTKMQDSFSGAYFDPGVVHMNGDQALRFSRDRHDFPQSDIIRTHNQGLLILDSMRSLRKQMQNAPGEFKMLALLGRHAQLDGIGVKDLYRLGRVAFSLNPDQIKNITLPTDGGNCLSLASSAPGLFADLADDGVAQNH